ncbi:MAG: hypothetical protein IJ094_11645 [Bacilli bacterium]|nr:hypothetical protein [Bacilli bacterium]MBQ9014180.1 hypothetical protein [Bacilli bacterium]
MGKEYYIVTVTNGEDKRIFKAELGDRIMLKDRKFIVAGVTPSDELPQNVKVEPLSRDNKYKLKMVKKLTKK